MNSEDTSATTPTTEAPDAPEEHPLTPLEVVRDLLKVAKDPKTDCLSDVQLGHLPENEQRRIKDARAKRERRRQRALKLSAEKTKKSKATAQQKSASK